MTQVGMEIGGLVGPFWAEVHRYGHVNREEDESLHDLLEFCYGGEEYGAHFVQKIGDSQGVLWERLPAYRFTWEAKSERALWARPYKNMEEA